MMTSFFIRKKISASMAASCSGPHRSLPFDQVKFILVLYEAKDAEHVKANLAKLGKEKKRVSTCVFLNKGLTPDSFEANLMIREQGDLNFWGIPSKEVINQCLAHEADLLVNLCGPDCHVLHYLSLNHPCTFKAGINYSDQGWYDLALSATEQGDLSFLFDQLLFYLRSIRAE